MTFTSTTTVDSVISDFLNHQAGSPPSLTFNGGVQVLGQSLTGDFTLTANPDNQTFGVSSTGFIAAFSSGGNQVLAFNGASANFTLNSTGIVGSANGTLNITAGNVNASGTVALNIDSTAATTSFEFDGSNITVGGETLVGGFSIAKSGDTVQLSAQNASASFGGGVATAVLHNGTFTLSTAGVKGLVDVSLTAQSSSVIFGGDLQLDLDTTGATSVIKVTGSNISLTTGGGSGPSLVGGFDFSSAGSNVSISLSNVGVTYGAVAVSGINGNFTLTSAGFTAGVDATVDVASLGYHGTLHFAVDTTQPTLNLDVSGTISGLTIAGVSLNGTFDFSKTASAVDIDFSGVTATLGPVTGSNISGHFTLGSGGVVGTVSSGVTVTLPSATLTGMFGVSIDTTGGNNYLKVQGTGVDAAISGATVHGDFVFEKRTVSSVTTITAGVSNATAFLGSDDGQGHKVGLQIAVTSGGLLIASDGVALNATGSAQLVGITGLTLGGTMTASINTTAANVNQQITIAGANGTADQVITLNAAAGEAAFSGTANLTVMNAAGTNTFASLVGGFSFTKKAAVVNGALTTTDLVIGAAGVQAFVGEGTPPDPSAAADSTGATGVLLRNGGLGLLVRRKVDTAVGSTDSGTTIALDASGTATLLGLPGLNLGSPTLHVKYNNTGGAVTQAVSVPNPTDPTQTISHDLAFTDDVIAVEGTITGFTIANPSDLTHPFVTLSGGFSITKSSSTSGNVTTTTLSVGATGVDAFFGVGPATDANAVGVHITSGQLGLQLLRSVNTGNPAANTSSYALDASGSASLLGVTNLGLSGTLHVKVNNSATDVATTIDVPDPANDGQSVSVGINVAANTKAVEGTADLSIGDPASPFVTVHGGFAVTTQSSVSNGVTTTELDVGAAGLDIFAGYGTGASQIGLQIGQANVGAVIFKTHDPLLATQAASTYAVYASGNVALVGLPGLHVSADSLTLQVNHTGQTLAGKTIDVPNPDGSGNTISIPMAFDNADDVTKISATGLNISVNDSSNNPIVSITGNMSLTKTTDFLDLSLNSVTVAVAINNQPIVSLTGSAEFTIGSSTSAHPGFALKQPFSVTDVAFLGQSLGGSAVAAASPGGTSLSPNTSNTTSTRKLGPLTLTGATASLSNFSFAPGSGGEFDLGLTLNIGATSAVLAFGAGNSNQSAAAPDQKGVVATLNGITGSFAIAAALNVSTFKIDSLAGTGAFTLSASNLTVVVPNVLTVSATGVSLGYDPNGPDNQTLLTIQDASINMAKYGITGTLSHIVDPNDSTKTIPGLTIRENGFQLGRGTISVGTTLNPQTISISSFLSFTNPFVTITDLSYTFGTTFNFSGSISVGAANATIGQAGALQATASNITATLNFLNNVPSGFTLTASTVGFSVGSFVTIGATGVVINPDAGPTETLAAFTSVTATINAGPLNLTASAGSQTGSITILGDGSLVVPKNFTISFDPNAGVSGAVHFPSFLPLSISDITLSWPDFSANKSNFTLAISAEIDGNFGPIQFSGGVDDLEIDPQKIIDHEFPIVKIGDLHVHASGNVFGGTLDASLAMGIVNIDASGAVIPPSDNATPIANSLLWTGVRGGFQFGNIGVQIQFGLTADGPLEIYFGATAPIVLDPISGIDLTSFYGGVTFNATPFPDITNPNDLRSPLFKPALQIPDDVWVNELEQETANQLTGGAVGFLFKLSDGTEVSALSGTSTQIAAALHSSALHTDFINHGYGIDSTNTVTVVTAGQVWLIGNPPGAYGPEYLVEKSGASYNVSRILTHLTLTPATMNGLNGQVVSTQLIAAFAAAGVALSATAMVSTTTADSEWQITDGTSVYILRAKGNVLAVYGHGGSMADLNSVVKIEAGATLSDEYAANILSGGINIIITTDGKFFIDGFVTVENQLTFDAKIYADLTQLSAGTGKIVFLADLPENPALVSVGGDLTFQFTKAGQPVTPTPTSTPPATAQVDSFTISLTNAFLTYTADNFESLTIAGDVALSFSATRLKFDFDASISFTGDLLTATNVATASGEFIADHLNDPANFTIWGAAKLTLNLSAIKPLATAGISGNALVYLRINSSNQDQPITLPAPPGGSAENFVLPAQSFGLLLAGNLEFQKGGIDITVSGLFSLQADANGFQIFALAQLNLGSPSAGAGSFEALGLISLTKDNTGDYTFGARLELAESIDIPNVLAYDVNFRLFLNSTGQTVTYALPADFMQMIDPSKNSADIAAAAGSFSLPASLLTRLKNAEDSNGDIVIPAGAPQIDTSGNIVGNDPAGPYAVIEGNGNITIFNKLTATGGFTITINSGGFTLQADATVTVAPLGTVTASGFLNISHAGVYGALTLVGNLSVGSISFDAAVALTINSTDTDQNVLVKTFDFGTKKISATTQQLTLGKDSFSIHVQGDLDLAGSFTLQGDFEFSVNPDVISITVDAEIKSFFNLDLQVNGSAKIYRTGNTGLTLNLDIGTKSAFGITGIFTMSADVQIEINTRSIASDGLAASTYSVALNSLTVNFLDVLTINGSASASYSNGIFRMSGSLSVNFFNVAGMTVAGFFQSDGQFDITLDGYLNLGSHGFGLFGQGHAEISRLLNNTGTMIFAFSGYADLQGKLFGITLAEARIDISYDSGSGRLHVEASVRVNLLFVHFTIHAGFTIGFLQVPPPPVPATLASDGTLYINVGDRASLRGYDEANVDESSVVTGGAVAGDGTQTITVELNGQKATYTGVRRIVGLFGAGDNYAEIDNTVDVPADIEATDGNNVVAYNTAIGGTIIVGGGNNQIAGGTGADTITVGGNSAGTATTVEGSGGGDTVTISSAGNSGSEYQVTDTGNNALILNGTAGADTVGLTASSASFGSTNPDAIDFSGFNVLTINTLGGNDAVTIDDTVAATTLNLGGGNDTVGVHKTTQTLMINASGGNVTVSIGNASSTVNLIGGHITVTTTGGNTTLNVIDTGSTAAKSATITNAAVTGLNMAGVGYSGIKTLNVSLGSGGNAVTINSTASGVSTTAGSGSGADTFSLFGNAGPLIINTGAGADTVNTRATTGALTINNSGGADTFNFGSNAPGTNGVLQQLLGAIVVAGAGSDVLNADDSNDNTGRTGTLTGTLLSGLGMASIAYTGLNAFNLTLGKGADIFTVAGTHSGTTNINTNTGADSVAIQSTSGATNITSGGNVDTVTVTSSSGHIVNNIQGAVNFTGGGGDTLTVDDTGSTTAKTGSLTSTQITGLGTAGIHYTGVSTLNLSLGSGGNTLLVASTIAGATAISSLAGNDTFNIQSTAGATTLNTGAGVNTINVGSAAPAVGGTVSGMQGTLAITGSGNDVLNVDDTGYAAGRTGNLTPTVLSLTGMANIAYSGLAAMNVSLGGGADTFTISDTHAGTVTILNSGGGNDTVNVLAIHSTTTVNAGANDDTIFVGSGVASAGGNAPLSPGMGDANGDGKVDLTDLNIVLNNLGVPTALWSNGNFDGAPTVDLSDLNAVLNHLGTTYAAAATSAGSTTSTITAGLTVNGGSGIDTLTVDDTGDTTNSVGNLTSTQITGLGMPVGITYGTLEQLNINLGSGGDTFTVQSTHANNTAINSNAGDDTINIQTIAGPTTVSTGDGNDTVNVGSTAGAGTPGTVNGIGALLTIDAGAQSGTDTLNVDDSADTTDNVGALFSTHLTGLGMAGNDASKGIAYTGFEALNITLGFGNDTLAIASTHTGSTVVNAGAGNDLLTVQTISGVTSLFGNAGDDTFIVNPALSYGPNGIGAVLNLDGQDGSDSYTVNLFGNSNSLINVSDTGTLDSDVNTLTLTGTPDNDQFLVRANFVGLIHGGTVERVNYNDAENGGLIINAGAGDDNFAVDDTSDTTTLNGQAGNDNFQIGQMFNSPRDIPSVSPGDQANTIHTTKGYLTTGTTMPLTANGGDGMDTFVMFHNIAAVSLNGGNGDDTFIVRAFALFGSQNPDPNQKNTHVNGGGGTDNIQYAINAPVSIDGGEGFDKVVVIGTEFNDTFVVTKDGVYGAGVFVGFVNVESLEVDAGDGDDSIYVLSTSPQVKTTVYGEAGNDHLYVGQNAPDVVSNTLLGYSSVVKHTVDMTSALRDTSYDNLTIPGISANVADANAAGVVVTQSGPSTVVSESGQTDTYSVVLTKQPTANVIITVNAPALAPEDQAAGIKSVLVQKAGGQAAKGITLTFTPANWNLPQTVTILGQADGVAEGNRGAVITQSVVSADASYKNLAVPTIVATIIDNDSFSAVLTPTGGSTDVLEGGFTDTYSATLTRAPSGPVTLAFVPDSGMTLSYNGVTGTAQNPLQITFTSGDWNLPHTITVSAADDHIVQGMRIANITTSVVTTSALRDTRFDAAAVDNLTVNLYDANTPTVIVTQSNGSTNLIEGGSNNANDPKSDTYTVQLSSQPKGNVYINVSPQATNTSNGFTATLNSSVTQLLFTPANWNLPQTVVLWATNDGVVDGNYNHATAPGLQTLTGIQGPLFLDGGLSGNPATSIPLAIKLPTETDIPPLPATPPITDDSASVDTLTVNNTDAVADNIGTLTSTTLTGLGMGGNVSINGQAIPGGITYNNFEINDIALGSGNDTLNVTSVAANAITTLRGDAGNDTFNITAAAASNATLVVYGDTNASGTHRNADGNDTIDAHTASIPLIAYGGGGNDTILGGSANDLIAGGSGNDFLQGNGGNDIILGDSGFDVEPYSRDVTIVTSGTPGQDNFNLPGNDTIDGGLGNDILFGDHGTITQVGGVQGILVPGGITQTIETANEALGGNDTITDPDGRNVVLGGAGQDSITTGNGNDVVLGDNGIATFAPDGTLLNISTRNDNSGDADTISTGNGADVIFGGLGGDTINSGSDGSRDVVVGDQGNATFSTAGILLNITSSDPTFGGNDVITTGSGNDVILGGQGNDTIQAGSGNNVVLGDDGVANFSATGILLTITTSDDTSAIGNDSITTGLGVDVILGGSGADLITAGDGNKVILGDNGNAVFSSTGVLQTITTVDPSVGDNDTIITGTGADVVFGGAGSDTITTGAGNDIVLGDNGNANFNAAGQLLTIQSTDFAIGGNDTITTNDGNDLVIGGAGNDTISSGNGNDVVIGDSGILQFNLDGNPATLDQANTLAPSIGGNDIVYAGDGSDTVLGGAGDDTLDGGNGNDIILGDNGELDYTAGILVTAKTTDPSIGGNDTITGDAGNDLILGGAANDTVSGGDDQDVILGDNGQLTFNSTTGILTTATTTDDAIGGSDTLSGDNGNDVIIGGTAGDTIHGGAGDDLIAGDQAVVNFINQSGTPYAITIASIDPTVGGSDTITGDDGNDVIIGGTAGDTISGGNNNDLIAGDDASYDRTNLANQTFVTTFMAAINGGGNDTITGDAGNDAILGGTGNDILHGGDGNDLVFGDNAILTGNIDLSQLPLPNALKPFTFTAIDTTTDADNGNDLITGDAGDDILLGGPGADTIYGGDGNDDIIGGSNVAGAHDTADNLDGGAGNDNIAGDNASILRTGTTLSARDRVLSGTTLFDANGNPLVTAASQLDPEGNIERNVVLFDQSGAHPDATTFGGDNIAGGAGNDLIFGQLGNDVIQGDSSITVNPLVTGASVEDFAGVGTDGNDYIEGNGGNDTIYGDLGQDDIVGGSSDMFSLTTPDQRPDGSDTIFGGAGTRIAYNDAGDTSAQGHARDADVILGDNGDIYRIVGTTGVSTGHFLTFTYDNYAPLHIIPRSYKQLDYTPGTGSASDIGAADTIQGEAGDDIILGQVGNDVLFGNGQDDNIYGGAGADRIYGGTGDDGILGDDGFMNTSRNGLTEPLNGVTVANVQTALSVPGPFIGATEYITGQLLKTGTLVNAINGANDLIYGGLGNDFIHGGAGDDAISGAEAQLAFYNTLPVGKAFYAPYLATASASIVASFDPLNPLGYNPTTRKLAAYDANNPLTKIANFFLNFDAYTNAANQDGTKIDDGKDRVFGDIGNDWLVGGTGHNRLFGGAGDDLMNADNNLDTNGGLNNMPDDATFADADFVYGGDGLDVMIANTGGDRMFDWSGEFNSYIVPFAAFGDPTVIRSPSPALQQFLLNLGKASGADQSFTEPSGELGLFTQKDPQWGANKGSPRDPQPGNIGGSQRDTQGGPENDAPAASGNALVAGATVATGAASTAAGTAILSADWSDPTKQSIYVFGTSAADTIDVHASTTIKGNIEVTLNGKVIGSFTNTAYRLYIYGGAGNDLITVQSSAGAIAVFIWGEAGNDTITAGAGSAYIDGGDGADTLNGGLGRNILIGGAGADILNGGAGEDIMVGGLYNVNEDIDSASAILAEWSRTDLVYAQRITNLQTGAGLAAGFVFNASAIINDGSLNRLYGNGGNDWFFASTLDLTDWKKTQETWTLIS